MVLQLLNDDDISRPDHICTSRTKAEVPCRFPKSSELSFSGGYFYPGVLLTSITPLSSSKLYNDVVAFKDLAHLETPLCHYASAKLIDGRAVVSVAIRPSQSCRHPPGLG